MYVPHDFLASVGRRARGELKEVHRDELGSLFRVAQG